MDVYRDKFYKIEQYTVPRNGDIFETILEHREDEIDRDRFFIKYIPREQLCAYDLSNPIDVQRFTDICYMIDSPLMLMGGYNMSPKYLNDDIRYAGIKMSDPYGRVCGVFDIRDGIITYSPFFAPLLCSVLAFGDYGEEGGRPVNGRLTVGDHRVEVEAVALLQHDVLLADGDAHLAGQDIVEFLTAMGDQCGALVLGHKLNHHGLHLAALEVIAQAGVVVAGIAFHLCALSIAHHRIGVHLGGASGEQGGEIHTEDRGYLVEGADGNILLARFIGDVIDEGYAQLICHLGGLYIQYLSQFLDPCGYAGKIHLHISHFLSLLPLLITNFILYIICRRM